MTGQGLFRLLKNTRPSFMFWFTCGSLFRSGVLSVFRPPKKTEITAFQRSVPHTAAGKRLGAAGPFSDKNLSAFFFGFIDTARGISYNISIEIP